MDHNKFDVFGDVKDAQGDLLNLKDENFAAKMANTKISDDFIRHEKDENFSDIMDDFEDLPAKPTQLVEPIIPAAKEVQELVPELDDEPEIPELPVQEEERKEEEEFMETSKKSIYEDIETDYLNPYKQSKFQDNNEKFISSEDLLAFNDGGPGHIEVVKIEPPKHKEESLPKPVIPIVPVIPEPVIRVEKSVEKPIEKPVVKVAPVTEDNQIEAEKIFKKFCLDAWFKPESLHPKVESLIYWRDVKKSAVAFGIGSGILLAMSMFSLISVVAYLSLITLVATISFRIYKTIMQAVQKTSEGHPFKEFLDFDLTLKEDKVQQIAGMLVTHFNAYVTELRRLFFVEDIVDSVKFGFFVWVLTYVGAIFNGMTIVILSFVAMFTLPKVYETNKQSIDTYLDLVRSKIMEITEKVKSAIPIGGGAAKKEESDKDK